MTKNPIKLVYDAFWEMLEAQDTFLTLFPHGSTSQVRYNEAAFGQWSPEPDLEEVASGDLPQFRLMIHETIPKMEGSSNGCTLTLIFSAEIYSGQQDQGAMMDAVWPCYAASTNWREYIQDTVTYQGMNPVISVDPMETTFTNEQRNIMSHYVHERQRGIKQWVTVWQWRVLLSFKTSDLQATQDT